MLHLQNIPIFKKEADRFLESITQKFGFRKFFVGHMRFSVVISRYGGGQSSVSNKATPKNLLNHSADQAKLAKLTEEADHCEEKIKFLKDQHGEFTKAKSHAEADRVSKRTCIYCVSCVQHI